MNAERIYPLTIIADRYNGAYSGGSFLAFNQTYDEIPYEIGGGDVDCRSFWLKHNKAEYEYRLPIGKGNSLMEALKDLENKLKGEK